MKQFLVATTATLLGSFQRANASPVNLFTGATVTTNDPNSSYPHTNVNDGDTSSQFIGQYPASIGEYVQLDLGSSKSVQTIGMVNYITGDPTILYVYIGDVPGTDPSYTSNTSTNTIYREGIAACVGTGQYVIFRASMVNYALNFSELYAWDAPLSAATGTSPSFTNAMIDSSSPNTVFTDIFGTTDGTADRCIHIKLSSQPAQLEFNLSEQTNVDYVWIYIGSGYTNVDYFDVQVQHADYSTTVCTRADFAGSGNAVQLFSDCGGLSAAVLIIFTFDQTSLISTAMQGLCRIGIFGQSCSSVTPTVTEDSYSGGTTTFDLLADTLVQIPFPTVSATPDGCFSQTWQAYQVSNDVDVEVAHPSAFAITSSNLDITHIIASFGHRNGLFNTGAGSTYSLYFAATFSDTLPTVTSQFPFNIQFTDACRTATVLPQTITYTPVKFMVDTTASLTVPAFTDSVDTGGLYATGICGEKQFVLDPSTTPAFLSFVPGTDPVLDPFQIDYDETFATEADIMVHTITYTVSIVEYSGITTDFTGTFTFEIVCPDTVVIKTLDTSVESFSSYDLASGATLSLLVPTVSLLPVTCFSVSTFNILDGAGNAPAFVTLNEASTIEITTDDRAFKGTQTLTITTVILESGEQLLSHTFDVDFTDSCDFAYIVENAQLETITAQAQSPEVVKVSYASYTDSVSDFFGLPGTCGPYVMTLEESAAPDYVALSYTDGDATFIISVDPSEQEDEASELVLVSIQLENYPQRPKHQVEFLVVLDPAPVVPEEPEPWVPPPPPEPIPEKEPPIIPEVIEVPEIVPTVDISSFTPAPVFKPKVLNKEEAKADELRQNVNDDQMEYPYPVPFLSSISETGIVLITFTEPMQAVPDEIDFTKLTYRTSEPDVLPEVWKPVMTVSIDPSVQQDPEKVRMHWELLSFEPTTMQLQVVFDDPLYISFESEPDQLVITLADPGLFITENGIQIPPESRTMRRNLKRQIPSDAQSIQDTISSAGESAQLGSAVILIVNILLAVSLQELFGLINALQLIILLPLLQCNMPGNTGNFFAFLTNIAAFDIFDIDEYILEYLDLPSVEPASVKFETIGLESQYFMNNLGTFTVVLIFKLLLIFLWVVLYVPSSCSNYVRSKRAKLGNKIFWNSWIMVVNESFVIVALCILITLRYNTETDIWGQKVQIGFMAFFLFLYLFLPILATVKVLLNFNDLKNPEIRTQYGALYTNLATKHGKKVLIQPIAFLVRRLLLAGLVVLGNDLQYVFQIAIVQNSTLLSALIYVESQSQVTRGESRMNFFNESTILLVSYFFLTFNVTDVEINFQMGYAPIGIVSIYIGVSVILLIVGTIIHLRKKIRRICVMRGYKKQRKYLQIYLKNTHGARKQRIVAMREQAAAEARAAQKKILEMLQNNQMVQEVEESSSFGTESSMESSSEDSKGKISEVGSSQEESSSSSGSQGCQVMDAGAALSLGVTPRLGKDLDADNLQADVFPGISADCVDESDFPGDKSLNGHLDLKEDTSYITRETTIAESRENLLTVKNFSRPTADDPSVVETKELLQHISDKIEDQSLKIKESVLAAQKEVAKQPLQLQQIQAKTTLENDIREIEKMIERSLTQKNRQAPLAKNKMTKPAVQLGSQTVGNLTSVGVIPATMANYTLGATSSIEKKPRFSLNNGSSHGGGGAGGKQDVRSALNKAGLPGGRFKNGVRNSYGMMDQKFGRMAKQQQNLGAANRKIRPMNGLALSTGANIMQGRVGGQQKRMSVPERITPEIRESFSKDMNKILSDMSNIFMTNVSLLEDRSYSVQQRDRVYSEQIETSKSQEAMNPIYKPYLKKQIPKSSQVAAADHLEAPGMQNRIALDTRVSRKNRFMRGDLE